MLQAFKKHVTDNRLLHPEDHVIIATSGGPDSMVLTDLLIQLDFKVQLAHMNFGLRGDESDEDEAFLDRYAKAQNIPIHIKRVDTEEAASLRGQGIQEAARNMRYRWFESLREELDADVIVTAHQRDDAHESYLWHILRGSSLSGFDAIPAVIGNVVRPLLPFSKKELLDYALTRKIEYRTDSSNQETKYARNRIRHELIPLMKQIRPGFEQNLDRQIALFDEVNFIIDQFIGQIAPGLMVLTEEGIELSVEDLEDIPFKRLMLMHIGKDYGFPSRRIDELIRLIDSKPGKALYSSSHRVIRERETLVISTLPQERRETSATITKETKEIQVPEHILIEKGGYQHLPILGNDWDATLDAEKIEFPITIRSWKEGDRMRPLGLKGSQLLSDIFTQAKWSHHQKEQALVFESAGEIIWLAGLRIADHVKVTPETKEVLRIIMPDKG